MRRLLLSAIVIGIAAFLCRAEVTLQECLDRASENYPLIKKYDLLASTEEIELSDINKNWLPRIGVYGQGTLQNTVPSFPSALSNVMQQMGGSIKGLGKLQYKVGVDVNQIVWDGGASKSQREIAKRNTGVNRAALDVEVYAVRQRVESIYFAILLIESQIKQMESALGVYESNLKRLKSMVTNGVAMQCDADMVEAQMLGVSQQLIQAKSAVKGYRDMLSIFTGAELTTEKLRMPEADLPADMTPDRPEQTLFNAQMDLNNARRNSVDVTLMPKVGFFAQSYYGYPGIDYFKAMMGRDLTFNIVAGVKVSWNIDSFYTKKNSLRKLGYANSRIEAERETFLFNNSMQTASQLEEIRGIESVMKDDARIVELRRNVRVAAESQLRNGIIDATALTTKINDEIQASLAASYHTIQRLQAIYNLKNTLNR